MHAAPADIAALLRGRTAQAVRTGESGARVLRYAPDAAHAGESALFLKTVEVPDKRPLGDEAARLRWMAAQHLPVPAVRHYTVYEAREYLLLDEVPGVDASVAAARIAAGEGGADVATVVHALADALRRLHATAIADCPFRHLAPSRIAEARERTRLGLVDETDFDEARWGRRAEDLLAQLEALRPAVEDAVFTHGDYCLPNVVLRVDASEVSAGPRPAGRESIGGGVVVVSGFIDCGRAGLADRHQDLALGARSIAFNLGAQWVPEFFERYGSGQVDAAKLRFYTLLDEFF